MRAFQEVNARPGPGSGGDRTGSDDSGRGFGSDGSGWEFWGSM